MLRRLWNRFLDSRGFVVMSTMAIFLFLFILCAFVYAVGETIHQRIKMQNACDAAAYSAAVVQADGLSRMATINRAMSWTYVQMTNRQMDYVTYRWLKLTCRRFDEDFENAKNFNHRTIMAADKELGWWAFLEAALTGLLSEIIDKKCSGMDGVHDEAQAVEAHGHKDEAWGHGWWCGLEDNNANKRKNRKIHLNLNKDNSGIWNNMKAAATESLAEKIFDKGRIESFLKPFSFIDKDGEDGYWLGFLIDFDKKNINNMNNALGRINRQMTISMKMASENVLKAMLQDGRLEPKEALKDYFISINIPEGKDPYKDVEDSSDAPKSFFSPLRNTEADEMLFLNMNKGDEGNLSLAQHFPTFLGGNGTPYGLDKWFIRGTAEYSDDQQHCYDGKLEDGVKFKVSGENSVVLRRNEGALGIQRVYKDANLNDTKAGFWNQTEKKVPDIRPIGTYFLIKNRHASKRNEAFNRLHDCCKRAGYYDKSTGSSKKRYVYGHPDHYYGEKTVIDTKFKPIYRGNHLLSLDGLIGNITSAVGSFVGGSSSNSNAAPVAGGIGNNLDEELNQLKSARDEAQGKINNANTRIAELRNEYGNATPERKREINNEISILQTNIDDWQKNVGEANEVINAIGSGGGIGNTSIIGGGGNSGNQAAVSSGASGVADVLTRFIGDVLGKLAGQYLDIQPSCGNNPTLPFEEYPACRANQSPTTALYSEYRWASAKWLCLTKGWTYTKCLIFGKPIYCDYSEGTIKIIDLGIFGEWHIKGDGYGHWSWDKWFCGAKPNKMLIDNLPPLYGTIEGAKHGYMKGVLDFLEGFPKPILPLWDEDEKVRSREDYESCATFPDGLDINPFQGHKAYPGLFKGHARIYADDKEIFNNRYVGAICKPWVLNERFFAGEGTIVVGAAMKHVNPLVQLFNFLHREANATQSQTKGTLMSAFNIPSENYMWTMSAARAGVRHRRRNGAFDQERQYQITYDSTSDTENLRYASDHFIRMPSSGNWTSISGWGMANSDNEKALSRIHFPADTSVPVWDGCPCNAGNGQKFNNVWNLCETDWDATLLPLRYSGLKANLHLSHGSGSNQVEDLPLNEQDYEKRLDLIDVSYDYSASNGQNEAEQNDMVIGDGNSWQWQGLMDNMSVFVTTNPFVSSSWKKANATFFENLVLDVLPSPVTNGLSASQGLNLNSKVPDNKNTKTIDVFTILKDKVL